MMTPKLMHEGEALRKYIKDRGLNASALCERIGKSKNYLQAQYGKEIIDRKSVLLLNKGLDADLYEVLGITRTDSPVFVSEPNEDYEASPTKKERLIIDFENGAIKNIKRHHPDTETPEETRIIKLEHQLERLHTLLLEMKG